MSRTCWLTMPTLLVLMLTTLAACGGAPQAVTSTSAPEATTNVPTEAIGSTAAVGATAGPAATALPVATMADAGTIKPGDTIRNVMVNSLNRAYLIHIPSGLDQSRTVPVVFAFHGFDGRSAEMQALSGFDAIADKNGWLVVYPQGSGSDHSWNGGMCCGSAKEKNVDEIAFTRQILADLETIASIDAKRVYALGFSNGGGVVYRLGCEMSDIFAAIAVVSSVGGGPCEPQQPVSLLHVHGLEDTIVPYAGGGDIIPGGFPPIEEVIATWVKLNGCAGTAQVETQQPNITHTFYDSCQNSTVIELYTVGKADHEWGSIHRHLPISKVIGEFFTAHPKP